MARVILSFAHGVRVAVGTALVASLGGEVSAQSQHAVVPLPSRVVADSSADRLHLRRGAVDPLGAVLQARAQRPGDSRRLRLVQFDRPPDDDDLARLEATGARIVDAVPRNGFLLWSDSEDVDDDLAAGVVPRLRASLPFDPSDALAPVLDAFTGRAASVEVVVQFTRVAPDMASDVARAVQLADAVVNPAYDAAGGKYTNLHLRVPGTQVAALAELDSVVNVEPYVAPRPSGERQAQIVAGALGPSGATVAGPGYFDFLAERGFSAVPSDYPIVVIVDDGVDNGTTSPLAADFYEAGDAANPSRLAFAVVPPGVDGSDPSSPEGHGTINASIVAGFGSQIGPGFADAQGYRYGLGFFPFGRFANVRVFTPSFNTGNGNTPMVADYYARGARISNNSWGADMLGAYNTLAQEYDALTRDARPSMPGHQPMLFVFAGGNAGPNPQTVNAPGSAKNVVTVGASETHNPAATVGSGCGDTAADADDVRDMTRFSSRGPTADGRIKPDIVAPGTFVHGLASQPVFTGYGVCGPSGNDFAAPGDDALFPQGSLYTWSAGTSVAAPAISGFAALAYEYLGREHGLLNPSPALLKAFLLHSAKHMTGNRAGESLPGVSQGYGRADMGFAFDRDAARLLVDQSVVLGNPGQRFELVGEVADPTRPVRVVLTWTDPPGPTFAAAYINDLDLQVEIDGLLYQGNHFDGALSQPGGTPDTKNNTEAVFLPPGSNGLVRIDVSAAGLGGDGVPGNADPTDQDFALVAHNIMHLTSRGELFLDRPVYACGASVGVTLADGDLKGVGSVLVSIEATTGDVEPIELIEDPPGSGAFTGVIVSAEAPVAADGILQVGDGVAVAVEYQDEDDGSSSPATVIASALFDCVSPVVAEIGIFATSSEGVRVRLETDEVTTAYVRYGLSCDQLEFERVGHGPATLHEIDIPGLDSETTYFFRIEAVDPAGNVTVADDGGDCFTLTTPVRPTYYVESFTTGFDLAHRSISFTPDASASFYSVCSAPASEFPTDPSGGTVLPLGDDAFVEVALGDGNEVSLFGVHATSFFVGSNGYVTLGEGDSAFAQSPAAHFALPRIAALFEDLNPGAGGSVSVLETSDRVAVTFANVPVFPSAGANSFQIELFFDGRIRVTYLAMSASSGIVGLSAGGGQPDDFQPFKFASSAICIESRGTIDLDAQLYACNGVARIRVADGDLIGEGSVEVELESSVGDVELLVLLEDDVVGGIFSAQIPLRREPVAVDDGTLQVESIAIINATYVDADSGHGEPSVVSTAAVTLCTDPMLFFQAQRSAAGPRFYAFSPVHLADGFRAANYKVRKVDRVGAPAESGGVEADDPDTYLREYRLGDLRGTPRFARLRDVRAGNRCGLAYLDLRRVESVLVPAAAAMGAAVMPPAVESHRLDHFTCYKASEQRRLSDGTRVPGLAKGTQISLADPLNGGAPRRYDVRKVTRLCTPTAVDGSPLYGGGPLRGTEKSLAAVAVRSPLESLVCYSVRAARKWIEQDDCGPRTPGDRGTTIQPAQPAHVRIAALHTADAFAATVSSTRREVEVCLPSLVEAHCQVAPQDEGSVSEDCVAWSMFAGNGSSGTRNRTR